MIYFVRPTPDEMRGYQQTTIVTPSPLAHFVPADAEGVATLRGDMAAGRPPAAWTLACELDAPEPVRAHATSPDVAKPAPQPSPKRRRAARPERGYVAHQERLRAAARKRLRLYRMFVEHMDPAPDDVEAGTWRSPNIGPVIGVLSLRDARAAEVTGLTVGQYRGILYAMSPLFIRFKRYEDPRTIFVHEPSRYLADELMKTYHLGADEIAAAFDCVDFPAWTGPASDPQEWEAG